MQEELKTYIKNHLKDIGTGDVSSSIVYCPPLFIAEYVEVLKKIDLPIHPQLEKYVSIASIVGQYGTRVQLESHTTHATCEEYVFRSAPTMIDSYKLYQDLNTVCSCRNIELKSDLGVSMILTVWCY